MFVTELLKNLKQVPKKWGNEYWIVNNESYCAKLLFIKEGWRTSMHKHSNKKETFFVFEGEVEIKDQASGVKLRVGDILTIQPESYHAICGTKRAIILEVSTHHEDKDSYRLDKSQTIQGGRNVKRHKENV